MNEPNAVFYSFKPSGKWYATGRGYLNPKVFKIFEGRREQIVKDNDGRYPGLSGPGSQFILVVIGDDLDFGYPLLFHPIP